jgi:hypothetical protein
MKSSSRGIPHARTASPVAASVSYPYAVSIIL